MESRVIQSQDSPVRKIQVNFILSLIELYFSYNVLPASSLSMYKTPALELLSLLAMSDEQLQS